MLRSFACSVLLASASLFNVATAGKFSQRATEFRERQLDMAMGQMPHPDQFNHRSQQKFRFLNSNTQKFRVNSLPDVHFDIGEMYSGLIPIDTKDPSRALFFVFEPKLGAPVDEITIWLNGGPGCSSLEGFFQENGRFQWQPGVFAPVEAAYSWVNLTNVLWVEQPVGTGFSIGEKRATSEEDIAADFVAWFLNFQKTFGISKFKIFVTGESYAGRYVPYISAAMLDQNDTTHFDLSGALVYDPCIGEFLTQQIEIPTLPFVQSQQVNFNLNASFMAQLEEIDQQCGYAAYRDEFLVFPASGVQPPLFFDFNANASCDINDIALAGIIEINPCHNPYEVNQECPIAWDVLGFPTFVEFTPAGSQVYFNRSDVKKAMHAPNIDWSECSGDPFVGDGGPQGEGDLSADPIQKVLPQVIEATNRVLVANGDYDFVILTNGTLLSIQNMTWNGKLGFEQAPSTPIDIQLPDLQYAQVWCDNGDCGADGPGQGIMGVQHFERGLMWAETFQSGHMQPQFQPRAAFRHLQWVLGHIETL